MLASTNQILPRLRLYRDVFVEMYVYTHLQSMWFAAKKSREKRQMNKVSCFKQDKKTVGSLQNLSSFAEEQTTSSGPSEEAEKKKAKREKCYLGFLAKESFLHFEKTA